MDNEHKTLSDQLIVLFSSNFELIKWLKRTVLVLLVSLAIAGAGIGYEFVSLNNDATVLTEHTCYITNNYKIDLEIRSLVAGLATKNQSLINKVLRELETPLKQCDPQEGN